MGYRISAEKANEILHELKKEYKVYAPKRFPGQGRFSDTDIIRYAEIDTFEDVVFDEKSHYPAKEVLTPIQEAIFYFTEDEYRESKATNKKILILARPCDINAQDIQAKIYSGNGGYTDVYYERMREKVAFALIECTGTDDTCFCCSVGANRTDHWSLAFRPEQDGLLVEVKDAAFDGYFAGNAAAAFEPRFVEENQLTLKIPQIKNKEVLNKLKEHPMWKEFNGRCISCGACTIACSTCTCFTTRDVCYGDNPEVGERRRVSASCQIAGYDQMAGQREFRATAGDRMRFKVLHKYHDYNARFGEGPMCVGCGRCTTRCPEYISITNTVRKMCDAVEEINAQMGQ